jgi:vacuolar-type H+-ATPase catalytic subunit A/Vma1
VFDALFPPVLGGTCVLPGAPGGGKNSILMNIAKYSNSEVKKIQQQQQQKFFPKLLVYVGCGEEKEVLTALPELTFKYRGKDESVMRKLACIVSTSNMPVASREVSIYTGAIVSEYLRDQGKVIQNYIFI